jgi:hypothetical protein
MSIVILNWKSGENDPFTVTNNALRRYFSDAGKHVIMLELTDTNWINRLCSESTKSKIDFCFSAQGLASSAQFRKNRENIWHTLKIPLICVHGDHPCHMPTNHAHRHEYCHNFYIDPSFTKFSNEYFSHKTKAQTLVSPIIHIEKPKNNFSGDYFVFIKNITHPNIMEQTLKQHLQPELYHAVLGFLENMKARLHKEGRVDFHMEFDKFLTNEPKLNHIIYYILDGNFDLFHQLHSQIDLYIRNYKSICALDILKEFRVNIYGRGWEALSAKNNINHKFFPGMNMANSQDLYYSRFGIIDISPGEWLHDRTLRAIANKTSFLSSGNPDGLIKNPKDHTSLFFDFTEDNLTSRCTNIAHDPDNHRQASIRFSESYQSLHTPEAFTKTIIQQAKKIKRPFPLSLF